MEIGTLILLGLALSMMIGGLFDMATGGNKRDQAQKSLNKFVESKIERRCQGSASWVQISDGYDFAANIDQVVFSGSQFKAIMKGSLSPVTHSINNCSNVRICQAGTDVSGHDCPGGGYIPAENPSFQLYVNPGLNKVIIDPPT